MNLLLSSKLNLNKYQSKSPVFLRDTKIVGFAIKVNPSGAHKYVVEFSKKGRSKRITLGAVNLLSLPEARDKALSVLAEADAYLAKSDKPVHMTLAQLINEYLNTRKLSEASIRDYGLIFNYFPHANTVISEFNTSQVNQWYAKGDGIPTTIDKIYRQLKAVFNYAVQMSYLASTPFNIPKAVRFKPKAKHDYLDPVDQLPKFWKALNQSSSMTRDILKMYLLTGVRSSELYKMKLNDNLITIPDTKNGTVHHLPVAPAMPLQLFAYEKNKWTKDCRKTIARVCKDAGVETVTIHGLRRTVASLCAYLNIDLGSIKRLLNHSVKGDVTLSHYIQYRADHLLPVMQKIDSYYKSIS